MTTLPKNMIVCTFEQVTQILKACSPPYSMHTNESETYSQCYTCYTFINVAKQGNPSWYGLGTRARVAYLYPLLEQV
jgi:hypothetical protein